MVYRPRIVDSILDRKLSVFGAVVITGPKGCGKTTTAKQKAKSVIEFQDEDRREGYLSVASEMPSKLLEGTMPVAMQTSSLLSPGFVPFPRFLLGRGILPPFVRSLERIPEVHLVDLYLPSRLRPEGRKRVEEYLEDASEPS